MFEVHVTYNNHMLPSNLELEKFTNYISLHDQYIDTVATRKVPSLDKAMYSLSSELGRSSTKRVKIESSDIIYPISFNNYVEIHYKIFEALNFKTHGPMFDLLAEKTNVLISREAKQQGFYITQRLYSGNSDLKHTFGNHVVVRDIIEDTIETDSITTRIEQIVYDSDPFRDTYWSTK